MGSDNTAFLESIEEELEVWLLEQSFSWPFWIRRIGDDNVELVLVIIEEFKAISNVDLDLGVLVADGHAWEVLLGQTDDSLRRCQLSALLRVLLSYLVDITQDSLLNTVVLDDLAQNTSITTTNNENLLGSRVGVHRQVGDHLLV